jgi:23S rRNA pseudouridine1911/1915/1917 synthase
MNQELTFQVEESDAGDRLDRFLSRRAPDLSRARIKTLIDDGLALLEGRKAKAGAKLKSGAIVTLTIPEVRPPVVRPDPAVAFEILYQDADIIVVNKPPGLVVHPAPGHSEGTLVHGLLAACEDLTGIGGEIRPGIVHRLDRDTSGIMVIAKTDYSHKKLVDAFKHRNVEKVYAALCIGKPKRLQGEVEAPIGRHPVNRKKMSTSSRSGRFALTRYEVTQTFKIGVSFFKVHILTGRTHQIRVHLASIGCPVLGDTVYGRGTAGLRSGGGEIKGLVKRQMLHANRLTFEHPVSGEQMQLTAPLPQDMTEVLTALKRSE